MTTAAPTAPIARRRPGFDLSKPVLAAFALILLALIAMPLSWLVFYAFRSKSGGFTLDNFHRLASDAAYLDPLLITFALATLSAVICCVVAAPTGWLVSRTDMPLRRTVRLLVTASFVTPPFLGAIADRADHRLAEAHGVVDREAAHPGQRVDRRGFQITAQLLRLVEVGDQEDRGGPRFESPDELQRVDYEVLGDHGEARGIAAEAQQIVAPRSIFPSLASRNGRR